MLAIGPEQEAAFERVRRMHRREQMKMFGQMGSAGGAVDLFDVARNAGVLENDRVEAMLRSYEAEIDPIYKRTIEKMWAFGRQQLEQMQIGFEWNEETIQKMQESMAEFQDMAKQAREINLRYARQVMQLLPEAEQASWDRKVKERIWPTVYRPSKAERQIEAAMKLEDLSAQQRREPGGPGPELRPARRRPSTSGGPRPWTNRPSSKGATGGASAKMIRRWRPSPRNARNWTAGSSSASARC
ncbi:MAG: hypothetical protein KatS3mg103_0906 [Phycisphaerales bacterium]|nr:MAG: hypothetical protein KatS3mg103_0906 [Phycisphaerales bacterium]